MFYTLANPWQEMEHIQQEMNRMFDMLPLSESRRFPPINIWASSDSAVVTAGKP